MYSLRCSVVPPNYCVFKLGYSNVNSAAAFPGPNLNINSVILIQTSISYCYRCSRPVPVSIFPKPHLFDFGLDLNSFFQP